MLMFSATDAGYYKHVGFNGGLSKVIWGLYGGCIGIMEKKMATTI